MLNKTPFIIKRIPQMALAAALIVLTMAVGSWAADELGSLWLRTRAVESVFEYERIEYVGSAEEGLRFESEAIWHVDLDEVHWNDVLYCNTARPRFVSSQNTSKANVEARGRETTQWVYGARVAYTGEQCYIRATITARIGGVTFRDTIDSEIFIPERSP